MATVYLAEDLRHKRKVAVKVLRPELAAVLGAERFVQEITTTASLQHPHILPLFDSGQADGFLYYVMPYIQGETLREKLSRETQLGIDEAVRITCEVADAVESAPRQGVIHRDIKPENILLHDGRAIVADFGIALAVSAAAGGRMTETGLSLGTPHYMSPEQATAEKHITNRSDVYSLGCVLYEMLSGEPPHTGASAQAIIMKIVTEDARPVTALRKSVPPHVAAATAMAVEKLPADRFETAKAFADALRNPAFALTAAPAATARSAGTAATAARSPTRRPAVAALTAVTAVTAVLAAWGWLRPVPVQPTGVARYAVALPEPLWPSVTTTTRLAVSPDGTQLVYAGPGANRTRRLFARARDQLSAVPLTGTDQAVSPFMAPDGRRVGFFVGSTLRVASLGGEPPVTVLDSGVANDGGAWSGDGYLYVTTATGIGRVTPRGGPPEPVTTLDSPSECVHRWPEPLPDGRGLLFTVMGDPCADVTRARIALLDLESGERRVLMSGVRALYTASGHLVVIRGDGAVVAAPLDLKRLTLAGEAVPIFEGVAVRATGAVDVALSRTGRLLYVPGGASGATQSDELVWVSRAGVATPVDPAWRFASSGNAGWALSPDGSRAAIKLNSGAGQDIWVKQLERGPASRLTFGEGASTRPRWTADGKSVMYISQRGTGPWGLFVRPADGTGSERRLAQLDRDVWEGTWSADGGWLLLRTGGVAGQSGGRDILGMRPGTDSVPRPLLVTPFDEKAIALSPDGRWLAYESNETGRNEIYIRPFPHLEGGKWQVSSQGGRAPLWAHASGELFYLNLENEMTATRIGTAGNPVGASQILFQLGPEYVVSENYTWFDIAPDDKRFLMVRVAEASVFDLNHVTVVDGFFEELTAKAGRGRP